MLLYIVSRDIVTIYSDAGVLAQCASLAHLNLSGNEIGNAVGI